MGLCVGLNLLLCRINEKKDLYKSVRIKGLGRSSSKPLESRVKRTHTRGTAYAARTDIGHTVLI